MTRTVCILTAVVLCTVCLQPSRPLAPAAQAPAVRFDVNDVSFLWPMPTKKEEVAALISLEEKLMDGGTMLSQDSFDVLLKSALSVRVKDSTGQENKIVFASDDFKKRSTWKIAGVRVDPSAPGTEAMLVKTRGTFPQVRLIVQPVTMNGNTVTVHDVAAHIVFNFIKGFKKPAVETDPPIAIPDEEKFGEIVKDLVALKGLVEKGGTKTEGKLSVHPGFKKGVQGFPQAVKAFLQKHLSEKRLAAMAFMGIDPPEPWIFVALQRTKAGTFAIPPNASAGGASAQMFMTKGGTPVMPRPTTTNVDAKRGVSTAMLFPLPGREVKLDAPVFSDKPELKHKDIPDLIAHPQLAHVFNTDCVSCHTESTRRSKLKPGESNLAYKRPTGVSGVDEDVLPKSPWNVRNFGWFPGPRGGPTAVLRTANEAAESVEFIQKKYLGGPKN